MNDNFYSLIEEHIAEITRYKEMGAELPSQVEEIETYVREPAEYFITFTSDLRPKLRNKPQGQEKDEFNEVRGRRKRKRPEYEREKGLPWWKKGSQIGKTAQKSPASPKLGINPQSKYNTPNGIYSYPLNPRVFKQFRAGELPFAQDKPHFSIFRIQDGANILTVDINGNADLVADEEEYNKFIQRLFSDVLIQPEANGSS